MTNNVRARRGGLRKGLLAATLAVATSGQAHSEDIIVGVATSFSGWMAAFDTNPTRAAQLAVDEINANGGLLGNQLELVHVDTKTDQAETARAAQELVSAGAKVIMVACDFDMGAPAALVAQQAGIIAMSSCGADDKLGNMTIGNNVFTMATEADGTGRMLADWAYNMKGWRSAYVLLDTFIQYDKSLCAGFVERWSELAGANSIVLQDEFKNSDVTVASQISRYQAKGQEADLMMLCSVPPGLASAIRQFRSAGIDIPILAGTGGDSSSWHSAVPGLSNYYHLSNSADAGVEDPRSRNRDFFERYKAAYGELPASGQGITGYSVIEAWARAVEKAGTFETDAVRAALESFSDEELLVGPTSFTAEKHSNDERPMLLTATTDGKTEALGYYDMATGEYMAAE
ncbi:ABC transporter substrate-binding protein [Roseovarius atlanticus]|uniref:ABC transporter substrate-binding protein n=1 Tax=Roseovarius atlanticus TaxID=1641875 RepID=UPI001C977272|nr:ABC transporter substrate-binding protein [Roseovarius atlanticus]MBY5989102.1 ABC transporter substrate-binding protein [Roseovarius atlanticus]MBY6124494.1 ABC transporter substrate-binding protein [Roseovarius atlanticus]MBY6148989.1 ABC transporter substrate-binding protein [Roseovarius atlanticus]